MDGRENQLTQSLLTILTNCLVGRVQQPGGQLSARRRFQAGREHRLLHGEQARVRGHVAGLLQDRCGAGAHQL